MSGVGGAGEGVAPGAPRASSTRKEAIRGSAWTLGGYALGQVIRLVSSIVVADRVAPEAYGLMGIVIAFLTGLQMFSDIGIGPSLIRSARGEDPAFRNTAWTIGAVRGFGLFVAAVLIAWPAARMYGYHELLWALPVGALTAVINGVASTSLVLLNRRMQLGKLTVLELAVQVVSSGVMIAVAFWEPTVWALLAGAISACVVRVGASYFLIAGHRDRFAWEPAAVKELVHFGRWIFISTLITFFAMQSDRLLIPLVAQLGQAGVYGVGLTLSLMAYEVVLKLAGTVQFPALSRFAEGGAAGLGGVLHKTRGPMLVAALVSTLVVGLGAEQFFETFYRPAYWSGGWMCLWLAPSIWFTLLQATSDRALLALGDSRSLAVSNACRLVGTIAGCLVGFKLGGLEGFLAGRAFGAACGHAAVVWALKKRGLDIVGMDVKFSLVFFVVLVGVAAAAHAADRWSGTGSVWRWDVRYLVAAGVLTPLTAWAVMSLKKSVVGAR